MQLTTIHRPELKYPPFSPRALWRLDEDPKVLFDQLRYQDVLVHHPYQSFGSVEAFLRAAVKDPHVAAIKITLYRIGANSPLINLLIQANMQERRASTSATTSSGRSGWSRTASTSSTASRT